MGDPRGLGAATCRARIRTELTGGGQTLMRGLVHGRVLIDGGRHTGALPGRVLRRS